MDIKVIEELVKIIEASSVKEFKYKDNEMEISISTLDNAPVVSHTPPPMFMLGGPMPGIQPGMMPGPGVPGSSVAPESATAVEEEPEFIISPIVATFYSAAAPDIPAYVKVGDRVKAGETVCILEAMKLMNEISADFDCEIEAILVSNEQRVEYGQPLFRVKRL